ncbi:MAG: hypothetical protein NC350_01225 [Corallococcus sp.]|nr:hypothetical protein [Corallococcus sp.]
MKKAVAILVVLLICLLTLVGCNSIPKENYDKLESELTTVQEENDVLNQKVEWLKKYQNVQFGATKESVIAVLGQINETPTSVNGEYLIEVLTWSNNSLYNIYEKDDNLIAIGFRNNVVIFKAYGLKNKNIIIDSGRGVIYTDVFTLNDKDIS